IEHGLDETIRLAQGNRLAVRRERELADPNLASGIARLLLGQTHMSHLRMAVSTSRNPVGINGMWREARDFFNTHDGFMRSLVRQPGSARHIAYGVHARLSGCAIAVGNNMAFF